jgi:putative ABC transport system ATP-binding protein
LGDEPTGDLDSTTSADVMDLFRRINRVNKQTLILVTHNRWIAEKCDYIVHMTDGQIQGIEKNHHEKEAKR